MKLRIHQYLKKIFYAKSVEEEAVQLFTQKKQLENQRDELRKLISSMCGPQAWQELLKMERDIRKKRQETMYAQREARHHFLEFCAIVLLIFSVVGLFTLILYFYYNRR